MAPRHFLDIARVEAGELKEILAHSRAMKAAVQDVWAEAPLKGKVLAMIFDKPSTRTRVSFDVGMRQLGGESVIIDSGVSHLKRGETVADTARVLSRYVDAIMIRTTSHDRLLDLTEHATVPVINGLTDDTHPCQIMADIQTFEEHRGPIAGKTVAWTGDGNNVVNSFMEASARFGFKLRIASPKGHEPDERFLNWANVEGGSVEIVPDAKTAVAGADCVVTDTWTSMHMEDGASDHAAFEPYQVNEALMKLAAPDAIFMHCLPAHRNEEVTDAVMDGPQSVVFDEAENRLHAQKAILTWCMAPNYRKT